MSTSKIASTIAELGTVRLLLIAILGLVVHVVTQSVYSAFFGPLSKFPGPKLRALSALPQSWSIASGREHSDYVALHKKYGKVVRIAPNELSFAGNAEVWKDVVGFKKMGQSNFNKCHRFYGGNILTRPNAFIANADDTEHTKLRRVVSHAFADKSIHDIEPRLLHWVTQFKKRLDVQQHRTEPIDMVKLYNCGTFDVMGDLAFNDDLGMLAEGHESQWVTDIFAGIKASSFVRAFKTAHDLAWWFIDGYVIKLPAARKEIQKTLDFTSSRLRKRLQNHPERPDLWTQIINKGVGDQSLDEDEHKGLAFFFMVAGTETTASALSAMTYFLLTHPEYKKKLLEELRPAIRTFADMTLNKLGQLKYLNAIISESLRMYPPVPIALPRRTPKQGGQVDGQYIPGDVICSVPHFTAGHNPDHFLEPDLFRPERWLGDPKYKNDDLNAIEPFHVGPRNCVGKNLAWHEMRLFFVAAFAFFDLELAPESKNWLSENQVFTVWQKPPLYCRIRPAGEV